VVAVSFNFSEYIQETLLPGPRTVSRQKFWQTENSMAGIMMTVKTIKKKEWGLFF
jgi:hypothetical protein